MGDGLLKPFIELNGKTILERTLDAFLSIKEFEMLVVLAKPDSIASYQEIIKDKDSRIKIVPGGKTRQQSVCHGLEYLKEEIEDTSDYYVAIHDAARCMISEGLIRGAMREVITHGAVTLAVPQTDSLIEVEAGTNYLKRGIDRSAVFAVQTPQVFSFDLILESHRFYKDKSILDFTDDCTLLDGMHDVYIVPGSKTNIKVTTPEDLLIAEAFLKY